RARQELGAQADASDQLREGLEPKDVVGRPLGAGGGFRFALLVLLVAALPWYLPTDPARLARGVVITLIGASLAAHLRNRARSREFLAATPSSRTRSSSRSPNALVDALGRSEASSRNRQIPCKAAQTGDSLACQALKPLVHARATKPGMVGFLMA